MNNINIVPNMVGDSGSGGAAGLVPAPAAGDTAANKYLKANGQWTTVAASGGDNFFWVGAAEMIPRVTNGPGINSSETTTNKVNYDTLDFDPSTIQYAQFWRSWPTSWATATATFVWTADSGSGAVVWDCQIRCCTDGSSVDSAFGTAQAVTDTLTAATDLDISAATSGITPAGTPSNGAPTMFQIYRDATNAADTLATNARLIGVVITKAS